MPLYIPLSLKKKATHPENKVSYSSPSIIKPPFQLSLQTMLNLEAPTGRVRVRGRVIKASIEYYSD